MNDNGSNKWWLFWTVVSVLAGIFVYSLIGFPKSNPKNNQKPKEIVVEANKLNVLRTTDRAKIDSILGKSDDEIPQDIDKLIEFAQKAACRRNVQMINMAVEFWYIKHEGVWPREDLSDIGRDTDYFPSGVPVCPLDGTPYKISRISHRVVGHEHPEIKFNYKDIDLTKGIDINKLEEQMNKANKRKKR